MAVKPFALLCILTLLVCLTQPKPDDLPLRSTEIRGALLQMYIKIRKIYSILKKSKS